MKNTKSKNNAPMLGGRLERGSVNFIPSGVMKTSKALKKKKKNQSCLCFWSRGLDVREE